MRPSSLRKFGWLLLAGILAGFLMGVRLAAAAAAPSDRDLPARFAAKLGEFVATYGSPGAQVLFVARLPESRGGRRAWYAWWPADDSILLLDHFIGEPEPGPARPGLGWLHAKARIDLRTGVVPTDRDVGGSSWLVSRPWADRIVRGCRRHGRLVLLPPPPPAPAAPPAGDIRERLLASARASDADLRPDSGLFQTHFSYVGKVSSRDGPIFVVDQRLVVRGMAAPRGRNHIVFFGHDLALLGKIPYFRSRPLWCHGTRLYLWGRLDGPGLEDAGNVIDLTLGWERPRHMTCRIYGSWY